MSQYVKDDSRSTGWKVVSYSNTNAPVTAEGMDEGADEASGGEEEPDAETDMMMPICGGIQE